MRAAVRSFGSFQALRTAKSEELSQFFSGSDAETIAQLAAGESLSPSVKNIIDALEQADARHISYGCENYPSILKEISDPPLNLFVRGNLDALQRPSIAIVGSR